MNDYNFLLNLSRPLTEDEYRFVKNNLDYYWQCKVFDKHIGQDYRIQMGHSVVGGGRSKYPLYLGYYKKYNSKLAKALR